VLYASAASDAIIVRMFRVDKIILFTKDLDMQALEAVFIHPVVSQF